MLVVPKDKLHLEKLGTILSTVPRPPFFFLNFDIYNLIFIVK